MKMLLKLVLLSAAALSLFGCATSDVEPRLAPPDGLNRAFLQYKQLPGNKVMAVAVDPGGTWTYGYDHSRDSLEEAARNAAIKCDKARKQYGVHTKAKLFAINDEVVYYDVK